MLHSTILIFYLSSIKVLNVSDNELNGTIPSTVALSVLNADSFLGNPKLYRSPLGRHYHILLASPS